MKINKERVPTWIKKCFKKIRNIFQKFLGGKEGAELKFQKQWVKLFRQNPKAVLDYWRQYRDLDQILQIIGPLEDKMLLEVGSGISTILHFLPGSKFGIDPLAHEYQKIYKYPDDIRVQKGFAENIFSPDNSFDLIICANVLDHVQNPKIALDEIHRVLKPNGWFLLAVEIFTTSEERDLAHPHSFTKDSIRVHFENLFDVHYYQIKPWFGLKRYMEGLRVPIGSESIYLLKKK